jgi:hypothetical protein
MRVNTLCFVVVVVVWTPFSFEEKNIEIKILIHREEMMDKTHLNIFHRMSKRAILTILTLLDLIGETVTEFRLVLIFMIQPFHSVVSSPTFFFLGALFSLCKFTELRCIEVVIPALVFN